MVVAVVAGLLGLDSLSELLHLPAFACQIGARRTQLSPEFVAFAVRPGIELLAMCVGPRPSADGVTVVEHVVELAGGLGEKPSGHLPGGGSTTTRQLRPPPSTPTAVR